MGGRCDKTKGDLKWAHPSPRGSWYKRVNDITKVRVDMDTWMHTLKKTIEKMKAACYNKIGLCVQNLVTNVIGPMKVMNKIWMCRVINH